MFFRFCYSSSFVVEHVCVFVVVLLLKNFGGKSRTKSHILWIEICLFPSLLGRNKGFLPSLQLLGPTTFPHFFGLPKKKVQQNPTKFLSPRCSREGPSVTLDPYPAAMGPTSPIVCRTRRDFRLVQVNPVRPRVMDFHHGNLRAPPECLPPPPRNKSRPYYGTVNH